MRSEARWPNPHSTYPWEDSRLAPTSNNQTGSWAYADSVSYNGGFVSLSDESFLNTPYHENNASNGAKIHIMAGKGWNMRSLNNGQPPAISATAGGTITTNDPLVDPNDAFTIQAGNEYYLTGKKIYLSTDEWFREGNILTFTQNNAKPVNVSYKARKYGFDVSDRSGITLKNLDFFACTIKTNSASTNLTLDGLKMKYLQHLNRKDWSDSGYGLTLYNNSEIKNSELSFASHGLLKLAGKNIKVVNNLLQDSGYYPAGVPMLYAGYRNLIHRNTLVRSGHSLISADGDGCLIQFNDLSDGMKLCTDGGLFYTGNSAGENSTFRYNIVRDSVGPLGHAGEGLRGFYLDNLCNGWTVHHNLIYGINSTGTASNTTTGIGFQFNSPTNFNMVFNNTTFNCNAGSVVSDFWGDGPSGSKFFNNFFHAYPSGLRQNWENADLRYNVFDAVSTDFVNVTLVDFKPASNVTKVINKGTYIPQVTDVDPSNTTSPAVGAFEEDTASWKAQVGRNSATAPLMPTFPLSMASMPYANFVQDPSFELGTLGTKWTKTGNAGLIKGPMGGGADGAWNDKHLRTGLYGLQFGAGETTISQTISGLTENTRYVFHCGVAKLDMGATVKLKVSSSGYPDRIVTVAGAGISTGLFTQHSQTAKNMYALPFATKTGGTSATVSVIVNRPNTPNVVITPTTPGTPLFDSTAPALADLSTYNANNINSAYGNLTGVYVDDLSVTHDEGTTDPQPYPMPALHFPFNEAQNPSNATTITDATTSASTAGARTGAITIDNSRTGFGNSLYSGSSSGSSATMTSNVPVPNTETTSFTVGFWLRIQSNAAGKFPRIIQKNNNTKGWWLQLNGAATNGKYNIALVAPSGGETYFYAQVSAQSWTHVAYVVDRARAKVFSYVNGEYFGEAQIAANKALTSGTSDFFKFGSDKSNWQMDDFQAWNVALDSRQIKAAASIDASLALRLKFDETSGTKAWDASGRGYNGTLSGASTTWVNANSSLKLSGSSGQVALPGGFNMAFGSNDSYTIAFHIKVYGNPPSGGNPSYPWIMHKSHANGGWKIQINGAAGSSGYSMAFLSRSNDSGVFWNVEAAKNTDVEAAKNTHVAITVNRTSGKLTSYVNGIQQNQLDIPFSALGSDEPLKLLSQGADWEIDDLRFYSRSLEWHELQQIRYEMDLYPY
jgi:hypothetical protein